MSGKKNRKSPQWSKPGGPPGGMQPRGRSPELSENSRAATAQTADGVAEGSSDNLGELSEGELITLAHGQTAPTNDPILDAPEATPSPMPSLNSLDLVESSSALASKADLVSALRDLRRAREAHELAARKSEEARAVFQGQSEECLRRESSLATRTQVIEQAEHALAGRSAAAERRHFELVSQEAQAEAGFPDKLAVWRSIEEGRLQDLRKEFDAAQTLFVIDREALDADRGRLNSSQHELKIAQSTLEAERELFDEKILIVREQVEAAFEVRYATLTDSLSSKETQCDRLRAQLTRSRAEFEALKSRFEQTGGLSVADLSSSRDLLRIEVDRLQLELASKPGHETVEAYKRAAERAETNDGEILRLRAQLHHKSCEIDRMRIPVTELENSRVLVQNMQLQYRQLKEANEALQADVESKLTAASDRQTFPELSRMDRDQAHQATIRPATSGFDLKSLAGYARARMANRPTPLHYNLETVRCFLAGLSMSGLHILQGISGTGKTSLPVAFADALGGRSDKIAVQAGWRDRQDLLGYYNAFDKRYHETEFIKALYRAQCPAWSDRLCLIILDEMNLSHIEQFGADLLAELESPHPEGAQLSLMEYMPPQSAALLRGGKTIAIPENVWFIGTANRDETTKDFADKSYDRAHTMELPRHQSRESLQNPAASAPISRATLAELFEVAKRTNKPQTEQAVQFIDSLEGVLKDDFDIGWGNRLERQIRDFVPVVVAAGGNLAEAVDHLISTKLLRKLEHRHNVRVADLKRLRKTIAEKATALGGGQLGKCEAKLASLIRERTSDEGEGS